MSAFGVIAEGKAPVFAPSAIADDTHCIYRIPDAAESTFVVVFLTNSVPFPPTHVARLFLAFQASSTSQQQQPSWSPLGIIAASKPSAVFKISSQSAQEGSDLLLGISVEVGDPSTMEAVRAQAAAKLAAAAPPVDKKTVASRIAQDFVAYAERYLAQHPMAPGSSKEWIPTSVVDSWITKVSAT